MSDTKPVLYLLPGLLCDHRCWVHQQAALSAIAEVRIPSFRGFSSLRDMAQSVLDDAPERFSVAGHSMGGRIAWELMDLARDRIERLCVLDTGVHPVTPEEPAKRENFLALAARDMRALAEFWVPPMVHPDRHGNRELMDTIYEMVLSYSEEEFRGQITALLSRSDQSRYLPDIEQEVLLICGAQDQWSPVGRHEEMQALLPHSRLEVIEHCGHMSTMERPEEVNRILLEWMKGGATRP